MTRPATPELGAGVPRVPGVYACRQWYGWRILEWTGTRWTYEGGNHFWPNQREDFSMWCGPLPKPVMSAAPAPAPALEFDL